MEDSPWILCCLCGTSIHPNAANMCMGCLKGQVDITETIPRQISLNFCRNCGRYLSPPNYWVSCQLESRELLELCLKRLRLGRVRLVDARFLWTEPHSKRIRLKLTVQGDVLSNATVHQDVTIEAVVMNQQCRDCMRIMAKDTWKAVVQARQKVDHKRTFMHLEQMILKLQAHLNCTNIQSLRDGLDFYFMDRNHAVQFVDFVLSMIPAKSKVSERLVSKDVHSGISKLKTTFSVEILPVCRNDLVCLPRKTAQKCSGINPVCLCIRVGTRLHLLDPNTLQTAELPGPLFWKTPFSSLCTFGDLVPFMILDVELTGVTSDRYHLAHVEVMRMSDFGRDGALFHVKTHLGRIVQPGDVVLGYDLTRANLNNADFEQYRDRGHDVVLVQKHKEKRRTTRNWKLFHLTDKTQEDDRDMDIFMNQIEEDVELQSQIQLYKNCPEEPDVCELLDHLTIE